MAELLLYNAGQIFTAAGGPRRRAALAEKTVADGDAVLMREGLIIAVGARADLAGLAGDDCDAVDCGGRLVTPGLVDCHTHLVYGGSRADEYEQRLGGASYLEIFEAGGGIHTSVRHTQQATEEDLFASARRRAKVMLRHGTTTAEVKSGYGLTTEAELKMLRVAARLDKETPLRVVPTFLGAHALPPEYASRREEFVRLVAEEMTPAVAASGLARYADVFCDRGAFSREETETLLRASREAGLELRLHADEFEALGGTELAVELGAAAVDHLAVVTDAGVRALAASNTVAGLLPGTTIFLGSGHFAPARKLVEAGALIAVGSDHNPGSCHAASLRTILTPAATYLRLRPAEMLHAVTINAAYSLGLADHVGSLEAGKAADVAVFDVGDVNELFYDWGPARAWLTVAGGEVVFRDPPV
ncbi:MAG: imidazolonepropionase [Candidatus Coatesbacteria bacterium]|nr:MAG: imidazolonepropionase [Candidatus Coatesbacteria bacterium]